MGCLRVPATTVLAILLASSCGEPETASSNVIRFGFFGPLTGPTAQAGQALYQGAQMRVAEINEAGGMLGRRIELISCDDKSSNDEGVKCVTRLIGRHRVFAIVGTLHSPIILATGPIIDRNKVPMVGAGTGVNWCRQEFEYVWRGTANTDAAARALGRVIDARGMRRIVLLSQNDDYGKSGVLSLRSVAGDRIVAAETFKPGDRDLSGHIIKLLAFEPDAVAVWALGDALGPITNQLRQQGFSGVILGPEAYTLPEAVEIAGDNIDGVVFASIYYIPGKAADYPDPRIAAFLQNFEERFGSLPASDNAYRAYDAVSILAEGIRRAGSLDAAKVRDAIDGIDDLSGLAGVFDFRAGGCEGIGASRLWTYRNRKIVPYATKSDGR